MKFEPTFTAHVKSMVSKTFELSFTPDWDGVLVLTASCGCTTFPKNKFDVKSGIPVNFEFIMLKGNNYTGNIRYNKFNNFEQEEKARTIINVIVE